MWGQRGPRLGSGRPRAARTRGARQNAAEPHAPGSEARSAAGPAKARKGRAGGTARAPPPGNPAAHLPRGHLLSAPATPRSPPPAGKSVLTRPRPCPTAAPTARRLRRRDWGLRGRRSGHLPGPRPAPEDWWTGVCKGPFCFLLSLTFLLLVFSLPGSNNFQFCVCLV